MGVGALIGAIVGGAAFQAGITLFGATLFASVVTGAALGYTLFDQRSEYSSPTYDFGPLQNTRSQLLPVPVIYGRNKVAGNIIYQSEPGKTINMLVALGEGEIQSVTDIRANDIPIGDVKDATYTVYYGTGTQAADARNANGEPLHYTAYVACTFTANEQISGSAPTVTAIVEGLKVDVWTGSAWVKQYSRNPAYCLLDFLTSSRYGLGIPVAKIDQESFKAVAAYCDELVDGEPRFQLDIVIDSQQEGPDAISAILATFGGFLVYSDGMIRLRVDRSEAPVQAFTMDNIVEGSFSYAKAKRKDVPNRIAVEFIDPNAPEGAWERSKIVAEDEVDQDLRGELNEKVIQLWGITRHTQAGRMARFYLDSARLCNTFCEFRVGIGALACEVGDIVKVSHDVPGWSEKLFRVLSIEEDENDEMKLSCREYDPGIYHDLGVLYTPPAAPGLPNPFARPPHVTNLQATEQSKQLGDGSYIPEILLTWGKPDYVYWHHAAVYVSEDDGASWHLRGISVGEEFILSPCVKGQKYIAKVVSVTNRDVAADIATAPTAMVVIGADTIPPEMPTGLTGTFSGLHAIFTWNPCQAGDFLRTRVEVWIGGVKKRTEYTADTSYVYTYEKNVEDNAGLPNPQVTLRIYHQDKWLNTSVAAEKVVTNPAPPQPIGFVMGSALSHIQMEVNNPGLADFDRVEFELGLQADYSDARVVYSGASFTGVMAPVLGTGTHYGRVRFRDKFGQWGPYATGSTEARQITRGDMEGAIFQIQAASDPAPSSGTLEQLWDMNTGTGPLFATAPTITFEYPIMWFFDLVRLYPSANVNYYVQAWKEDTGTWVDVAGSAAAKIAATGSQWNVKRFDNNKMVATRKLRIVFDAALTLYELKFWTVTFADEILAQMIQAWQINTESIRISSLGGAQEVGKAIDPSVDTLFPFDGSILSTRGLKPTFSRPSVAYLSDGTQVAAGVPRFEAGKFGKAWLAEEGTTNLVTNPFFGGTYSSGLAPNWLKYGTPTVYENTNPAYITYGSKSQRVVASAGAQGVVQSFAISTGVSYTAKARVYIVSGRVRLDCKFGTIWSDATISPVGYTGWWEASTGKVSNGTDGRLYVYSYGDAAEFYMDAAQYEAKPYATSFIDGTRSTETLTIPTAGVLDPQEGTVECWVYFTPTLLGTNKGSTWIFGCAKAAYEDGLILQKYGTTIFQFKSRTGTGTWSEANIPITDITEGWHHVAGRWSTSELALFIDGVKKAYVSNPALPISLNANAAIGWNNIGSVEHCNTLIDSLRVSKRAYTDAEIAEHAAATLPPTDPGGILDAGKELLAAEGNFVLDANKMEAKYGGATTFKVDFRQGSAWFKGSVEAGVLILPGAPPA